MKLIPLEEVEKLISDIDQYYADNHWVILWLKRDIESIDTIDPIAIIDEMIEENSIIYINYKGNIVNRQPKLLKELKSRLTNIDSN